LPERVGRESQQVGQKKKGPFDGGQGKKRRGLAWQTPGGDDVKGNTGKKFGPTKKGKMFTLLG